MPESDGLVPCLVEGNLCTPEENQAAADEEERCTGLDPSLLDDEGNYSQPPGCE